MPDAEPRRVLLIGLDAADWSAIRPLQVKGWMPNLDALMRKGGAGTLLSRPPLLSATLWTTIVTGVGASQHGVLGSREMHKDGSRLQPIGKSARRVPAIWNLLEDAGVASTVVGFPATHPADHVRGVCVSDAFLVAADSAEAIAAVWPPSFREAAESLRVTPAQIDAASILTFLPKASELAQGTDPRPAILRQILAQTASLHAVATAAIEYATTGILQPSAIPVWENSAASSCLITLRGLLTSQNAISSCISTSSAERIVFTT